MKKLLMAVVAFGMLLTSCAKDDVVAPVEDKEALVSFCVNSPAVATRYGEGETAQDLYYAVYDTQEGYVAGLSKVDGSVEIKTSTTVNLNLVQGRSYEVIFWAQAEGAPYDLYWGEDANDPTQAASLAKMTYKPQATLTANNEKYDAFYAYVEPIEVKGAVSQTVELKRPFAQLNVATADTALASTAGVDIKKTGVKVKGVYNCLNLKSGAVPQKNAAVELTFDMTDMATGTITANGKTYSHIAMNYVLVNEKELVDVTLTLSEDNGNAATDLTRNYTSVPVQRNYRTNIIGNILTSTADFNVEIKPGFLEDKDMLKWDGEELSKPTYDATTKTYYISHAAELAWIAALVNGTLPSEMRSTAAAESLEGETIVLEHDIDLNGKEWTPIGADGHHFKGTLDGQGNAIRNFKVTARHNSTRAALFGTVSGTIAFRNFTIENAHIECPDYTDDYYGAALIGTMYGNVTIENVKVINSYLSGNNKVGALIAHDGVCSSLTIDNCHVSGTTFEALNANDGGSVGGLIGFFQGVAKGTQAAPYGEHYVKNSTVKNCTFNVVNSTNTGKRANAQLIGGINSKAGQELYIDNCSVSGNTWNEKFYENNVEVTENTYVSAYGILIGGDRNDDPKGKVYINDKEVLSPAALVAAVQTPGAVVELAAGTHTFPTEFAEGVTLKCAEGVVFTAAADPISLNINGATVIGATFKGSNESNKDLAKGTVNGTFKDCTFEGYNTLRYCYAGADTVVFEGCTFKGQEYAVHFDSGTNKTLKFKDCKFHGTFTNGVGFTVIVENCEFYKDLRGMFNIPNFYDKSTVVDSKFMFDGSATKEEIRLHYANEDATKHVFTNCSINGAPLKDNTSYLCSKLGEGDKITIDGEVYLYRDGALNVNRVTVGADDVAAMRAALNYGSYITMQDRMVANPDETSGYGPTCFNQTNGGTIDGGNNYIWGYTANPHTNFDSVIHTTGGTIKNLNIMYGWIGIFVNNGTNASKVVLDNVVINPNNSVFKAFTCDNGSGNGLEATNCKFYTFISYAESIGDVKFTNCEFGPNTKYVQSNAMNVFAPTEFVGCEFKSGYSVSAGAACSFEGCTLDGVALTAANIATLVGDTTNVTVK